MKLEMTPDERSVLELLCLGKTNKDIAFILGMADAVVDRHVKRICQKLDAENRTQAVAKHLAPHLFNKEKT